MKIVFVFVVMYALDIAGDRVCMSVCEKFGTRGRLNLIYVMVSFPFCVTRFSAYGACEIAKFLNALFSSG